MLVYKFCAKRWMQVLVFGFTMMCGFLYLKTFFITEKMIQFSILRVTTLQWCLVYGIFQSNRGENKKKKLQKNGNIYSTPVFWQNRFNFVVIIQKLNNWRYLKCSSKMYSRIFYTFLYFQNNLAILWYLYIPTFEIWNFLAGYGV